MSSSFSRCCVCGNDGDDVGYVVLVYRMAEGGYYRRRYCAEWVSRACWAAYEKDCAAVGY